MMKTLKYALVATLAATSACTTATSNLTNAVSPKDLPGYSQTYDVVFGAALDAVSVLSWEITVAQKDAGIISAKTPMSLWTYGDKISVRIFRPDSLRADSLVRVGFTSGTDQAYDWGKNNRNQTAFYERLNLLLKPKP
jgi:hypothetical protein